MPKFGPKAGKGFAGFGAFAAGHASGPRSGTSTVTVSQSGKGSAAAIGVSGGVDGAVSNVSIVGERVVIDGQEVPAEAETWTTEAGVRFRISRQGGRVEVTRI